MSDWYLTEPWLNRWCCMSYWEGAGSENDAGPPMHVLPSWPVYPTVARQHTVVVMAGVHVLTGPGLVLPCHPRTCWPVPCETPACRGCWPPSSSPRASMRWPPTASLTRSSCE